MRRYRLPSLAAAVLLLAIGLFSAAVVAAQDAAPEVVLIGGEQEYKTTAASNGDFSFAQPIPPGRYRVEARNWPNPGDVRRLRSINLTTTTVVRGNVERQTVDTGGGGPPDGVLGQLESLGNELTLQLLTLWEEQRPIVIGLVALALAALVARRLLQRRTVGKVERAPRLTGPVDYPDLEGAEAKGVEQLDKFRLRLEPIPSAHPRLVIQLYLAYRDHKAWERMYSLLKAMPSWLGSLLLVRQQLGFALNRDGKDREAEKTLKQVLRKRGSSAETYGILARIYKDRWETAVDAGNTAAAGKLLDQAIDNYSAGFDCNPTNAYPGVNALTLMEFYDQRPEAGASLLPEVTAAANASYWSHAARLELGLLSDDEAAARGSLAAVLDSPSTRWELETTLRNLNLVRTARMQYGRPWADWQQEIVAAFEEALAAAPAVEDSSPAGEATDYAELQQARQEGVEALDRYRERLKPLGQANPRRVVQLYLAYRDHQAWERMYSLRRDMPSRLAKLTLVVQQLGFAQNRDGKDAEAVKTLRNLLRRTGQSAETYGILARVHKDRWQRAVDAGDTAGATKLLEKAIDGYLAGFNADPTNCYPGLNALTLMEFYDERPEERASLLREVTSAAHATYWEHAARLEAGVLGDDESTARESLAAALDSPHTRWEVETTFRNLRLVRTARMQFGRPWADWQREVVAAVEEEATSEPEQPTA